MPKAAQLCAKAGATLCQSSRDAIVDWLLAPHHGSRTSSSPSLVQALAPRWAVVQAEYRSRYGHPVPEVVQRYEAIGAAVVQSARCGAAHWRSASPEKLVCERERARRYWDVHVADPSPAPQ